MDSGLRPLFSSKDSALQKVTQHRTDLSLCKRGMESWEADTPVVSLTEMLTSFHPWLWDRHGTICLRWVGKGTVETVPLLAKVSAGEVVFTLFLAWLKCPLPGNALCRNRVSEKAEIWEGSVSAPG